jgi:hypothetical protein
MAGSGQLQDPPRKMSGFPTREGALGQAARWRGRLGEERYLVAGGQAFKGAPGPGQKWTQKRLES